MGPVLQQILFHENLTFFRVCLNNKNLKLYTFRTTDDNCVATPEADEERSEEARSWRDWTGIGNKIKDLI